LADIASNLDILSIQADNMLFARGTSSVRERFIGGLAVEGSVEDIASHAFGAVTSL
jgi:hypothetical protein